MTEQREMALIGWKGDHVQAAIVESFYTKFEIAEFRADCRQEGVTKFERIPASGVRLLYQ